MKSFREREKEKLQVSGSGVSIPTRISLSVIHKEWNIASRFRPSTDFNSNYNPVKAWNARNGIATAQYKSRPRAC